MPQWVVEMVTESVMEWAENWVVVTEGSNPYHRLQGKHCSSPHHGNFRGDLLQQNHTCSLDCWYKAQELAQESEAELAQESEAELALTMVGMWEWA